MPQNGTDEKRDHSGSGEGSLRLTFSGAERRFFLAAGMILIIATLFGAGSYISAFLGALVAGKAVSGLVAVLSWGLAEYFTKVRRLAITSSLLFLTYLLGFFSVLNYVLATWWSFETGTEALTVLGVGLAAWAHWHRFQVPIAVGAVVAAVVVFLMDLKMPLTGLLGYREESTYLVGSCMSLALGAIVFFLATYVDRLDLERRTRTSDIAFWLHLVAALCVVKPAAVVLTEMTFPYLDARLPWVVLAPLALLIMFFLFTLVSLAANRRVYLVFSSLYLFLAFDTLSVSVHPSIRAWLALILTSIVIAGFVYSWKRLVRLLRWQRI